MLVLAIQACTAWAVLVCPVLESPLEVFPYVVGFSHGDVSKESEMPHRFLLGLRVPRSLGAPSRSTVALATFLQEPGRSLDQYPPEGTLCEEVYPTGQSIERPDV